MSSITSQTYILSTYDLHSSFFVKARIPDLEFKDVFGFDLDEVSRNDIMSSIHNLGEAHIPPTQVMPLEDPRVATLQVLQSPYCSELASWQG